MTMTSTPTWNHQLAARNLAELYLERNRDLTAIFAVCDDGREFTYQEFWQLAEQLRCKLMHEGVRPGNRVAVQVEKSMEALGVFWACVQGGFIFLPLNTAYTASEISYFLRDAEATAFVVSPQRQNEMLAVAVDANCRIVLTLDDCGGGSLMEKTSGEVPPTPALSWDDIAAILYTSGTTGRSKGALLSHGNLASNALALVDLWQFTAQDRLLHALPVYHTHGLFTATNTVIFSGGQMLFRRKFSADDVMAQMPEATAMMGVPTFYTRLLQHDGLTQASTRHMRLFISGSAPLLAETHKAFFQRTGHAVLERYGMTETSMNASNPYNAERRAGTVGFALPHIDIRITDPASGQPLAKGEDGMIEIKGPNLFKGYWRNPQKTAEDMRTDGYFITGDLGRFDAEGYLVISGRAKDLIITGGFNVYPKEIEEILDGMAAVIETAVIGVPHGDFGEAVVAVVACDADIDEATTIVALKAQLAAFKVPKRILSIRELPRNAMGKVQKAELRKNFGQLFDVVTEKSPTSGLAARVNAQQIDQMNQCQERHNSNAKHKCC